MSSGNPFFRISNIWRFNKLFNKISAFEPEKAKVLKLFSNVPQGKLTCSSAEGLELLKKD